MTGLESGGEGLVGAYLLPDDYEFEVRRVLVGMQLGDVLVT